MASSSPTGGRVEECVRLALALALSCEDKSIDTGALAAKVQRILEGEEQPPPGAAALLEAGPPACLGQWLGRAILEAAEKVEARLSRCIDRVEALEALLAEARAELEKLLEENKRLKELLGECGAEA